MNYEKQGGRDEDDYMIYIDAQQITVADLHGVHILALLEQAAP